MGTGGGREISSRSARAVWTSTIALLQLFCPNQSGWETRTRVRVCSQSGRKGAANPSNDNFQPGPFWRQHRRTVGPTRLRPTCRSASTSVDGAAGQTCMWELNWQKTNEINNIWFKFLNLALNNGYSTLLLQHLRSKWKLMFNNDKCMSEAFTPSLMPTEIKINAATEMSIDDLSERIPNLTS